MGSYWSLFQCWNYKNKVHSQQWRLSLTLFILGFLGFRSTGGQFAPPPSFISELLMIWFWNLAWLWTNSRESFWLEFFDDVIIFCWHHQNLTTSPENLSVLGFWKFCLKLSFENLKSCYKQRNSLLDRFWK